MKKKLVIFLLAIINLNITVFSQENIIIRHRNGIIVNNLIEKFEETIAWYNGNINFEPIGWSNNGNFAYLDYEMDYIYIVGINLKVFNTVNDRMIENITIGIEMNYDREEPEIIVSEEEVRTGLINWNNALRRNRINRTIDRFKTKLDFGLNNYSQFPFNFNSNTFSSWFEATIENNINPREQWERESSIIRWRLIVSNGLRQKTIASGEETSYGMAVMGGSYLGSNVIGFIKNPHENRILVIVEHFSFGFEGEIDRKINIHGCHLDVGFN